MLEQVIMVGMATAFVTGALMEGGGYSTVLHWLKLGLTRIGKVPEWLRELDLDINLETIDVSVELATMGRSRLAKLVVCRWCTVTWVSLLLSVYGLPWNLFWLTWPAAGFAGYTALWLMSQHADRKRKQLGTDTEKVVDKAGKDAT